LSGRFTEEEKSMLEAGAAHRQRLRQSRNVGWEETDKQYIIAGGGVHVNTSPILETLMVSIFVRAVRFE
jgi:hypothetical protein